MIKRGEPSFIVRNCGLRSLYWGPHLRGQAPVFRVACPTGASSSPTVSLSQKTVSQWLWSDWNRQRSSPTDLCPSERTKAKPSVPYHTSVPNSQLGVGNETGLCWLWEAPGHEDRSHARPPAG